MTSHPLSDDQTAQVLNKRYNEECSFPQFALLPWELRNQIWRSALQQRRLIRVSLKETQPDDITEQEAKDVKYGRTSLFVSGFQLLSKLLRVNSEARNAALEFYRVCLPCVLLRPGLESQPSHVGIFPFNPEHDVLWFEETHHLPDFLSAIVAYDSRRVGLCNIAISLTNIRSKLEADDANKYQCPEFIKTINNIQEFYLITETNSYYLESLKDRYNDHVAHHISGEGTPITQTFCPLMSSFPAFDILPRDPRPIERDLVRLFLGSNHMTQEISDWKLLLKDDWGLDPSQVECRVLFIYRDFNPCLPANDSSYDEADQQRLRIAGASRVLHQVSSSLAPAIHLSVEGQEAQDSRDSVAFGFWMFPSEAFTQKTRTGHPQQAMDIWNLSDYWPELGLIHLPTGPYPEGDWVD
ncbi:hypothetical protein F4859DRAFT_308683 [Xylaria cf. heliscus]|nr:hypothetical protein F4859DRAFT_308683 [Xylaria cf. heliscus]